MQDINGLIGIIKGISFDNVINEKEIIHLETWIKKNRNLASEKNETELIKTLDRILEDGIVSDDERESLVKYIESFELINNGRIIQEFNGIIEGVLCDNELNIKEVNRLKEWMNSHKEEINNADKSAVELYRTIIDITEDGVVTDQEKDQLIKELHLRISENQLAAKVNDLLAKLGRGEIIGVDVIDMLDNESAMAYVHKEAMKKLREALNSHSGYCRDPEIIIVSLVLIAMLNYDGSFYDSVCDTYVPLTEKWSDKKIQGTIRGILDSYFHDQRENESREINMVLRQAIVPKNYLSAFFDFIFDIYKINFECALPEDLFGEFKFVYDSLKMQNDEEETSFVVNSTKKTYKLIATTKHLIKDEKKVEDVIKLSIIITKLIDKYYWGKPCTVVNSYLKTGFEGWTKKLKINTREKYTREDKKGFRSSWNVVFVKDENNGVYLLPPMHKVCSNYDFEKLRITVRNGNEEIFSTDDFAVRDIVGGYRIEPKPIKIDNPLGEIIYCLTCGDDTIYDSNSRLYRDYIVFDSEGKELENNKDYCGGVFICSKDKVDQFSLLTSSHYYNIGFKIVEEGEIVLINGDHFSFSSYSKPDLYGVKHENSYLKSVSNNRKIVVYKSIEKVVFENAKETDKIEICINDSRKRITDYKYRIVNNISSVKYIVDMDELEAGIHTIEVKVNENGHFKSLLPKKEFVYDPELDYEILNVKEDRFNITVSSSLFSEDYRRTFLSNEYRSNMIRFESNDIEYIYCLPLDIGLYCIDKAEWKSKKQEIWIGDIRQDSIIKVLDSTSDTVCLYDSNDEVLVENIRMDKNDGIYKEFSISFLLSYKTRDYVKIVFKNGGITNKEIYCYNKCVIDANKTEIRSLSERNELLVKPCFYGKNKVHFEITDEEGNNVYKSDLICSNQEVVVNGIESFKTYVFNFFEKSGLLLKQKPCIYECSKFLYFDQDVVGRVYEIKRVNYEEWNANAIRPSTITCTLLNQKNSIRITKYYGNGVFEGNIYRYDKKLELISPVEVEVCRRVHSGSKESMMEVSITKDGDGILFDKEKCEILPEIESKSAVDLFTVIISMKGSK